MKRILLYIFILSSCSLSAQSNFQGTIFGARNPNTYTVRPDTVGAPRFKYFDYTTQYLYNWNDSTEVWDKDSIRLLSPDVRSWRTHQQYLRGHKIYRALISQASSSAPTVTELENTIGSIVWTRVSGGVYNGTLTGAFPAAKTYVYNQSGPNIMQAYRSSDNVIQILTSGADSQLNAYYLEIGVYY